MYCQHCGEKIGERADRCQHCGQTILLPRQGIAWQATLFLIVLILGVAAVYLVSQSFAPAVANDSAQFDRTSFVESNIPQTTSPVTKSVQANSESVESANTLTTSASSLPASYHLPVTFGDIGPQLLAAGAIDYNRFVQTYERSGQALGEEELSILANGSAAPVVISQKNAYFLLNFFLGSWFNQQESPAG